MAVEPKKRTVVDEVLGIIGGGRPTSTYRSPEEQDALFKAGKTRLRGGQSPHNRGSAENPGAIDIADYEQSHQGAARAQAALRKQGYPNARVIFETGKGRNQGTGRHLHVELGTQGGGGGGNGGAGAPPPGAGGPDKTPADVARELGIQEPNRELMRDQGRSDLPTGSRTAIFDPFKGEETLAGDYSTARSRAVNADNVLTQATEQLREFRADRITNLRERNAVVESMNADGMQQTQALIQKVQPLFQQRAAIADRNRKLAEMNPIERGFMSLFDKSYDRENLAQLDSAITNQIQVTGQQYETILKAQQQLLGFVQSNYEGDDALTQMQMEGVGQEISLANQLFASADQIWGTDLKGMSSQSQAIQVQNQVKDTVISSLTPGQISTALNQARESGGLVSVEGAEFTEGELLQAAKRNEEQTMRFDDMLIARQGALTNQSEAANRIKERTENEYLGSLSTAQIRQAINNGGQINGQTFALDKLGQALQGSMQRDELMAAGTMQEGAYDNAKFQTHQMANQNRLARARITQMMGSVPEGFSRAELAVGQELRAIAQRINSAPPEQRNIIAQQYAKRLSELQEQQRKNLDDVANNWAGGNKKLKPLAIAFLSGQPLNSSTSVDGLIELARSNSPLGGQMSGEAAAAVARVKKIVAEADAPKQGMSAAELMNPQSKAEREAKLRARVVGELSRTYNNAAFNNALRDAPRIASQIGHVGKNLNPELVRRAIDTGDQEGLERVATTLGITAQEAQVMFAQGEGSAIWKKANQKAVGGSFGQAKTYLATLQQQATFYTLDRIHPKIGQWTAGAVYSNLLANPKFAQVAGQRVNNMGQSSFGDYIVGSIGQGQLQGSVAQYGARASQSYSLLQKGQTQRQLATANAYGNDPWARTATVLGAIPDLNANDEKRLMNALRPRVAQYANRGSFGNQAPDMSRANAGGVADALLGPRGDFFSTSADPRANQREFMFNHIREALNVKFDDPALEAIRRKAVAGFDQYSKITDEAIDRLATYSPEDK